MKKKLPESTDQHLADNAKKTKSAAITNALLIGFMMGIVIWSVVKNTVGIFTLVPLFFIYKLLNPKKEEAAKDHLKEGDKKIN